MYNILSKSKISIKTKTAKIFLTQESGWQYIYTKGHFFAQVMVGIFMISRHDMYGFCNKWHIRFHTHTHTNTHMFVTYTHAKTHTHGGKMIESVNVHHELIMITIMLIV